MLVDKLNKKQWSALPSVIPLRSVAYILNCSYPHLHILAKDELGSFLVPTLSIKKWLEESDYIQFRSIDSKRKMQQYLVNGDIDQTPQQIHPRTYSLGYRNYRIPKCINEINWNSLPQYERSTFWADLLFPAATKSATVWRWCNECRLKHYVFPQKIIVLAKKDVAKFLGV